MPIVKWPIPIVGKLADNRPIPIIGAPLVFCVTDGNHRLWGCCPVMMYCIYRLNMSVCWWLGCITVGCQTYDQVGVVLTLNQVPVGLLLLRCLQAGMHFSISPAV